MKHMALVCVMVLIGLCHLAQAQQPLVNQKHVKSWQGMDVSAFGPQFLMARHTVRVADLDEKNMVLYIVAQRLANYQFTGSKELFAYSISEEKLLWSMKVEEHARYLRVDTIPMILHLNLTRALHPRTGKLLWASKLEISRTLTGNKAFAVGYNLINAQKGELKAVEPQTGKVLWSFSYTHHTSSGTVAIVNDTSMVMIGSDLVNLNLLTGAGVHLKMDSKPAFNYMEVVSPAIVAGLLSSAFFFIDAGRVGVEAPFFGRNFFNCTMRDGVIYYASGKELKAFTTRGEEVWTHHFPKPLGSVTRLFFYNGYLYLISWEKEPDSNPANKGEVYMAKFRPADGAVEAVNEAVMKWGFSIKDFTVIDTTLVFSLPGRLARVSLKNLLLTAEVPMADINMRPQNGIFTRPSHLLSKDGILEEIAATRPGFGYLLHIPYSHIEFNPKLTLTKEIPRRKFYYFSRQIGNRMLLSNETERILFDENLKELPLRFSLNMRIYEHYICDWKDHAVVVLPISALLADF